MQLIENNFNKLSNTLEGSSLDKIKSIKEDLIFSLEKQIDNRTNSQLLYSVLNEYDCPTIDAKYWQIFRELKTSFSGLLSSTIAFDSVLLDIEEIEYNIEKTKNDPTLDNKLKNIKLRRLELQKKSKLWEVEQTKINSENSTQELFRIHSIWKELKEKLKHSDTNPDEHQVEAILRKCIFHLEVELSKGKVGLNEVYNLIGHLKSFKKAAKEQGIYEKIKQDLTSRQQYILDEKFDIYNLDTGEKFESIE